MKKFLLKWIEDFLFVAGCGCILYGLSQWNPVVTWVVAGLMLIGFGIMFGLEKTRRDITE